MRKLIVSNVMSLDGFFESTDKKLDWVVIDEDFFAYAQDFLRSADTLVFGRATYEHMAAYWPTAPKDEIANAMNNLTKLVFSRTLERVEWNNSRLVQGDPVQAIAALKRQPGKDMVILGSASVASQLLEAGLIDEYRVILNPVLLGAGHPLFKGLKEKIRLNLQNSRVLKSGAVILYYSAVAQSAH